MVDPELNEIVRRLAVVFARRQVRHALIGGLAVGLRSRPRATNDAGFIIHVPALGFPGLLEELVGEGFQIDVLDAIRRWPVERFLAFWCGPVRVDWMQPVLPIYATVLAAAEPRPWLDTSVCVATAEGLILTKMLAFRLRDQTDIEAILIANRDHVDLKHIRAEWAAVAEGEAARTAWLEDAITRLVPGRHPVV